MVGMTVLPARLTRFAPAGAFTSAARPTCVILPALTTMVALSITRPSPTITRAPSKTVTEGVCASSAADSAEKLKTRIVRIMMASYFCPLPFAFCPRRVLDPPLPGRVLAALVCPHVALFVVDSPLGEEPLAIHFHHLVLVVAVAIEHAAPFRIVIAVMEPVGTAGGLVPGDLDHDVGDVVTAGSRTQPVLGGPCV